MIWCSAPASAFRKKSSWAPSDFGVGQPHLASLVPFPHFGFDIAFCPSDPRAPTHDTTHDNTLGAKLDPTFLGHHYNPTVCDDAHLCPRPSSRTIGASFSENEKVRPFVSPPDRATLGYQTGVYWYSNKHPAGQMCPAEYQLGRMYQPVWGT